MDSRDCFTGISYDRDLLHHQPPPDYIYNPISPAAYSVKLGLRDSTERLTEAIDLIESRGFHHRCVKSACAPCFDHEILQIHTEAYLNRIKQLDALPQDKRTEELLRSKSR